MQPRRDLKKIPYKCYKNRNVKMAISKYLLYKHKDLDSNLQVYAKR